MNGSPAAIVTLAFLFSAVALTFSCIALSVAQDAVTQTDRSAPGADLVCPIGCGPNATPPEVRTVKGKATGVEYVPKKENRVR